MILFLPTKKNNLRTYLRTYVTCERTYVRKYVRTYVRKYVHAYAHTHVRAYVCTLENFQTHLQKDFHLHQTRTTLCIEIYKVATPFS